ncbi:MAG: hypothetical protein GY868_02330 [Deltaproteobacteria bacterium]|nr:hypothetical protein [Deltaproteobacteria bacterium]
MKILRAIKVFLLIIALIVGSFYGLAKYNNRRLKPDLFEMYKKQDTVPVGKVGVFVTGLIMPEDYEPVFFYNIHHKIAKNIIPWPFRVLAQMDRGIALFDPQRYCEFEEFEPTRLVDRFGSAEDIDGEPYIEKYQRGEVVWSRPAKMIHKDVGYFTYTGRKGGIPTLSGKMMNKARLWYYGKGIKQQKVPHWRGSFEVIDKARDRIVKAYPGAQWRSESSLYYYEMQQKLNELLDGGCETIVLAAPMAIYSHFEEFDSSFRHCLDYIRDWEQQHAGKKIKVIMAPPMGGFKPLRQAYLHMLKDRLDTLPEGADVTVAVTVHGLPYDQRSWEAWINMAPAYRDPLLDDVRALLDTYSFGRRAVVSCQDEFASHVRDPQDKYLSTNEAYWNAINEGFDYVIGLPIEFFAENTDTLFYHAIKNYEGFDEYSIYESFDYPDWSQPFTMSFKQNKTTVIYNGVPVGKYQTHVVDALYQSIDSVLKQGG